MKKLILIGAVLLGALSPGLVSRFEVAVLKAIKRQSTAVRSGGIGSGIKMCVGP